MEKSADQLIAETTVPGPQGVFINNRIRQLSVKSEPDRHFKLGSYVNTDKEKHERADKRIAAIIQDKEAFLMNGRCVYIIYLCNASSFPDGPFTIWKKFENMPVMVEYDQQPL